MRKTILLNGFIFLFLASFAQSPTISNAVVSNLTGRTIVAHAVNQPSFDEGPAGASKTWDYSGETFGPPGTSSYVVPSTAYGYSSFPSTTAVTQAVQGSTTSNVFQRLSGNTWSQIGISQQSTQGNIIIAYPNPIDVYRFPMTMGSSYTDPFHGTADYGSGVTLGRTGTLAVTVDGYGTLKTPSGTYNNVLRVKTVQIFTDTFYYPGSFTQETETNTTSYNWIAQAYPGQTLMNFSSGIADGFPIDYAFYVEGTPVGIEESVAIAFSVYPNPTTGLIQIKTGEEIARCSVTLLDLSGRELLAIPFSDMDMMSLDLRDQPRGMYMLRIEAEGKFATKRIAIE